MISPPTLLPDLTLKRVWPSTWKSERVKIKSFLFRRKEVRQFNAPLGSSILYVPEVFRKTNISYPLDTHTGKLSNNWWRLKPSIIAPKFLKVRICNF